MTKEEKIKIIKNSYKNMTYNEMALKCNCSRSSISRIIVELLKNNELSSKLEYEFANDDIEGEEWKQLNNINCKNYFVSNMGRIKNKDNILIKHYVPKNKYHIVKLFNDNNEFKCYLVHRLVAINFVDNNDPINKIEVDHINANKDDNRADNLQWMTPLENTRKAIDMGLVPNQPKGENAHNVTHTEQDVINVCEMLEQGYSYKNIIKKYPNYNQSWIQTIKNKRNWKHISKNYNF